MMLTDPVCQQITNTIKTLCRNCPRPIVVKITVVHSGDRRVRVRRRKHQSLEDYHKRVLAPELAKCFPHVAPIARDTVGLMAYLGPPEGAYPPQPLRDECLALAHKYTAGLSGKAQREKLVQVVLAYGCLWLHSVQSGIGRWDEHWPGALQELTDIAYNFVRLAINTLNNSVREFTTPEKDEQQGYANHIAGRFISLWSDPDGPQYTHYQTIHRWDPSRGSLYGWLQHAAQGVPGRQKRFPANMFTSGLLFPLLQQDHRLDTGPIAFRQCRHCGYPSAAQRAVEYRRDSCAQCQAPYTPTACRFTHQDVLFVPEVYLQHPLRRCLNHRDEQDNSDKKKPVYYDAELRECPDCHQKLSQTPTHLFVLHIWARGEALSNESKVVRKDIQQGHTEGTQQ